MSEGGNHLRDVDTFAAGEHRGLAYSRADIGDMVRNFHDFSSGPTPYHRVPAVLGHSENQDILDQEGLPAAAWATGMRQQGDHARTDLGDMPKKVAHAIRTKAYRTTSAEVWDRPPASIPRMKVLQVLRQRGIDPEKALADATRRAPATLRQQEAEVAKGTRKRTDSLAAIVDWHLRGHLGKMTRRLAFLGADVPELKNLDDLPDPEKYAELRFVAPRATVLKFREIRKGRADGTYHCFAEVVDVNPKEALAQHGLDPALLEGASPELLNEILRVCSAKDEAANPDDENFDEEEGEGGGGGGEEEQQQMRERAQRFGEKVAKFASFARKYCDADDMKKYAELFAEEEEPAPKKGDDAEPPMKFSEVKRLIETSNAKAVEKAVQKAVAALKTEGTSTLSELHKFAEETRSAEKKRAVDDVIDRLSREGRLPRVQREAVRARLLRADSKSVVEKFKEGRSTVEATEFDLQVRELQKAPSLFRQGARGTTPAGSDSVDDEVATVERFSESNDFGAALRAAGKTPDQYVEAFKEARKKKPTLTAKQYGVPESA